MKTDRQTLLDFGLRPAEFDSPADWDADNGYLDRLLLEARTVATTKITAVDISQSDLAAAEFEIAVKYYAVAEAYSRRQSFHHSSAMTGLQTPGERSLESLIKQYLNMADSAISNVIAAVGGVGFGLLALESGRYEHHN